MARSFDGVDDIIISQGSTGISSYRWIVGVWFRTSAALGRKIIGAESGNTPTEGIYHHPHLYVGTDGKLYWGAFDGSVKLVITPFTVTDNVWRCAVGVCIWNSYVMLFVDGQLIGTTSLGTYQDATCWWKIGGYNLHTSWPNGGYGFFPGEIGEVRVYRFPTSFQITDSVIETIVKSMYRRRPAAQDYLYLYYPLWEKGNPSFFLDHSGRYDNGTRYGTTYADDPPRLGGSMVAP